MLCAAGAVTLVAKSYLLGIAGHVGEHGRHVKHDLIALVGGVHRMSTGGVRCIQQTHNKKTESEKEQWYLDCLKQRLMFA